VQELAHLNTYLFKYKYKFLLVIFFIGGAHIFSIAPAKILKHTFDGIKHTYDTYGPSLWEKSTDLMIHGQLFKDIRFYIALILIMALLKFVCAFLMKQLLISTANLIEYELKNEIYTHYQNLSPSFYAKHNTGQLLSLIIEDVNTVKLYLGPSLLFILNTLILLLILIPYMIKVNLRLTLYAILPIPILFFILYYVKDFTQKYSKQVQEKLSNLTIQVQEALTNIRIIQAFTREKSFIQYFTQITQQYKNAAIQLNIAHALSVPLALSINSLGTILTVWIGGQEFIKGTITFGNIAEFVMYMHLITWPIISISLAAHYIQKANASQKRINQFLAEKSNIKVGKNLTLPIQGNISFKSITFIYPQGKFSSLENVSFSIQAGKSVLVLGTTGSGKTTLAHLITRLYEPSQGTITLDDIPIEDYDISWLRNHIGYVPQDGWLLPDTIRNNITFGKKDATEAELVQAIEQAGLTDTLQQLPKKLDTIVGEGSVTLSGGQRQRIALARALIRNPILLILDNSLSALDNHTEKNIWENLRTIIPGCTTFVISHKIADIVLFDHVIVLQEGRIIEQGSPAKLLAAKKFYHKIYSQQRL
jgi:ATP-binding cassette subfamily B multidrug efflux pump